MQRLPVRARALSYFQNQAGIRSAAERTEVRNCESCTAGIVRYARQVVIWHSMPKRNVSLKLRVVPIAGQADVVFKIKKDTKTLGTLTVRKDSLLWQPLRTSPRGPIEMTWKAFDEWMQTWQML